MRVLHLGGFPTIVSTVATHHLNSGIEVLWSLRPVSPETASGFDVLHVHGADGLALLGVTEDSVVGALGSAKARGSVVVYHHWHPNFAGVEFDPSFDRLGPLFDHVFLATPDRSRAFSAHPSVSVLPVVVDTDRIAHPSPYEPPPHGVKVLYVPYYLDPVGTHAVTDAVRQVRARGFKFDFTMLACDDPVTDAQALAAMDECHLFIETLQERSAVAVYGPLAVEALARGKAVLSASPRSRDDFWEPFAYSPVIDTNYENVAVRLEAVVKEPKCLRDLGPRSRRFAESYHDARQAADEILYVYEKATRPGG